MITKEMAMKYFNNLEKRLLENGYKKEWITEEDGFDYPLYVKGEKWVEIVYDYDRHPTKIMVVSYLDGVKVATTFCELKENGITA